MLVGDCAEILRCQVRRTKHDLEEFREKGFTAREAALPSLQSDCGFVLDHMGDHVVFPVWRENHGKYLLRANDILFVFSGHPNSIGHVGFVDHEPPEPTVCGTAFCIIRPNNRVNPVWLYWRLKSAETRNFVRSMADNHHFSISKIKTIPFRSPRSGELDRLFESHAILSAACGQISNSMDLIAKDMEELKNIANKNFTRPEEEKISPEDGFYSLMKLAQ